MWIYRKYITVDGRRVYPKNSKVFRFWVDTDDTEYEKVKSKG